MKKIEQLVVIFLILLLFIKTDTTFQEDINVTSKTEHVKCIEPATTLAISAPLEKPSFSAINLLGAKEYYILAKLLYREAGSMSWEGQVWVCSAIINLGEYSNKTIWEMAHNVNMFSVAPKVDSAKPLQKQYEVIEYVVAGSGLIPEVKYFRTGHYHTFWGAEDMRKIGNVYFSK